MFYDVYAELCKNIGKSPSAVAQELKINKSNVSNWKNNGYMPRGDVLKRIADYFGVSIDYLILGKDGARKVKIEEGICALIEDVYNKFYEKYVMADSGWQTRYFLAQNSTGTFILSEYDLKTIAGVLKELISILVEKIADKRPEDVVANEIMEDLLSLPGPKSLKNANNPKPASPQKKDDNQKRAIEVAISEIRTTLQGKSAPDIQKLTLDEQQILDGYRALNEQGHELVHQQMELVVTSEKYKKCPHLSDLEKQV